MIWLGNGMLKLESGEPVLRSCWLCNSAHEHLKNVNVLHACFSCGRYWIFDRFIDSFESDEEFDTFFSSKGMNKNDSTSTINVS
ncbi:MAG: hypothetical protein ACTSRG_25055 [Candidatus Helarchaeota archaeon]